ncbi:MAG: 1-deoxy-D-xylulose-5-phosphate reductoisomerase [Candidatus Riflebacteria bacterium]|nr:1-deoxy-D-xylulose-5-phosphate reductoisomerase [Candidatus Riflebacteria bacterium]
MKYIAILGSTGSIGKSSLEVVRMYPERLKVASLSAHSNWKLLAQQAIEFKPALVSIADSQYEKPLREALKGENILVVSGEQGSLEALNVPKVNSVIMAIVGAAALKPVLEAIDKKLLICLANKETMVVAGKIVTELAKKNKVAIVPVDSEHSAIFQCLRAADNNKIRRLILTASGGPFRTKPASELKNVTVAQTLKHPNWDMGGKITVDSATLMNKGLEVIEARWLFDVSYEQIDVVVHPQSYVHSMIEFTDASILAQIGNPDMKLPIQYALSFPDRWNPPLEVFDFTKPTSMTFEAPRYNDFPLLKLAYSAGRACGIMPAVMNAANEEAVAAFLAERISFTEIFEVVADTLKSFKNKENIVLADLLDADREARLKAAELIS